MFKIVMVDDIVDVLHYSAILIKQLIKSENLNASLKLCATNPQSVINFISHDEANLFLLDIDLKSDISGLQLAGLIRLKLKNAYIIFISGHGEFVFESFEVKPFDFLVKPCHDERFKYAILRAYNDYIDNTMGSSDKYFNVKSHSSLNKIKIKDLNYIEKDSKHVNFHSKDAIISCNMTLQEVEQLLINEHLHDIIIQIHKSYFVNKEMISVVDFTNKYVTLENGVELPIGRAYRNNLK